MGARAVHFALTDNQCGLLLKHRGTDLLPDVLGEIEDAWDEEWLCETEKAWDSTQRCFAELQGPLQLAVLGGEDLFAGEGDVGDMARLLRGEDVSAVAAALEAVTEASLRKRFSGLLISDDGRAPPERDFEQAWNNVQSLAKFFRRAATNRRAVLFSVYL